MGPRVGLIWYQAELGLEMELDSAGNQVSNSVSTEVDADLPSITIGGGWRWTPARDYGLCGCDPGLGRGGDRCPSVRE